MAAPPILMDHLLAALLVVVYPAYTTVVWFARARAQLASDRPGVRVSFYRETIVELWMLTGLVLGWWAWAGRPAAEIGLGVPGGLWFWIGAGVAVLVFVFLGRQVMAVRASAGAQAQVRAAAKGSVALMVPRDPDERRHWLALSLTAGICEEVLYRAFVMGYLATWLPDPATVAISAVVFGVAHLYLGGRGVIQATIAGAVFGAVYLLTRSLWVPMALHAAIDIASGLSIGAALGTAAPGIDTAGSK